MEPCQAQSCLTGAGVPECREHSCWLHAQGMCVCVSAWVEGYSAFYLHLTLSDSLHSSTFNHYRYIRPSLKNPPHAPHFIKFHIPLLHCFIFSLSPQLPFLSVLCYVNRVEGLNQLLSFTFRTFLSSVSLSLYLTINWSILLYTIFSDMSQMTDQMTVFILEHFLWWGHHCHDNLDSLHISPDVVVTIGKKTADFFQARR